MLPRCGGGGGGGGHFPFGPSLVTSQGSQSGATAIKGIPDCATP